jgi:zinc protease
LTLLLQPIAGADNVAVVAVYKAGSIDEPKGLPQLAHLAEHCAVFGSTATHPPGDAWGILQSKGLGGAETMPDFMHFDAVVPSAELDVALRIEAERLTSLHLTADLVSREVPRMGEELAMVLGHPAAPLYKYAVTAANQAWRFGQERVTLRTGLGAESLEAIGTFRKELLTPDNMTLVIAGGFDPAEARVMVDRFLGVIPPGPAKPLPPVDWAGLPREASVRWDVPVTGMAVAWAPPKDPVERAVLTLWGTQLLQRVYGDDLMAEVAPCVFCTNLNWPVGDLPFFLYATAAPGKSAEELRRVILARLDEMLALESSDAELDTLRILARQACQPPALSWADVQQQAAMTGAEPGRGPLIIVGNMALQTGLRERLAGERGADVVERTKALTPADLRVLIRRTFDPAQRSVTMLLPAEAAAPAAPAKAQE